MPRRIISLLGVLVAIVHVSSARASQIDLVRPAPTPDAAEDYSLHSNVTNDGLTTFSKNLGKGYHLTDGLRLTPYVEIGAKSWDSRSLGIFIPSGSQPMWRLLAGGVARYSLSRSLTLSFDLAVGLPSLSGQDVDGRSPALRDGGEDQTVWRIGGKLSYALSSNLSAFSTLECGNSQIQPPSALAHLFRTPSESDETSFRLGFAYRF